MKAPATVGRTVIIHKDRFAYNAHPSITTLGNGEWLVVFGHSQRRERIMHPPDDPLFRHLLTRTSDSGDTWEEPYFVPDFDWSGVEVPGISQLSNGTMILTTTRYGGYPLGLAKKRRAAGEPLSLSLPGRANLTSEAASILTAGRGEETIEMQKLWESTDHWTEDFTDDDWDRSEFSWARGYHGLYAHLSTDGGHTFEDTIKIDCSPYRDGFTRTGVVELLDGRVAYVVTEHHPPSSRHTYILFSSTGGQNWDPPILAVESPDLAFGEPDIAEVAPGEIYCILCTSKRGGYLYGCRSPDGGQSWSVPEATPMFGYPATIEYAPGRLFSCYYGQEPDGVTCIQGTHVTLK